MVVARVPLRIVRVAFGQSIKAIAVIPDYQVRFDRGPWHRRGAIAGETACGKPLPNSYEAHRDYKLDRNICHDCHSLHEIAIGINAAIGHDSAPFEAIGAGDDITPPGGRR